jgi:hypothetical protein
MPYFKTKDGVRISVLKIYLGPPCGLPITHHGKPDEELVAFVGGQRTFGGEGFWGLTFRPWETQAMDRYLDTWGRKGQSRGE